MTRRNPFDAVPLVAPDVTVALGDGPDAGRLVLRRHLDPGAGRLRRWLHLSRTAHLQLDAHGSHFWRQIDGCRDLEDIVGSMQREFGWDTAGAREAVLLFVKELMYRQFIQLKVSPPPAPDRAAAADAAAGQPGAGQRPDHA